jgi:hypothetical protein
VLSGHQFAHYLRRARAIAAAKGLAEMIPPQPQVMRQTIRMFFY